MEQFEFKKNWAGKWSLLECCSFGKEYTKLLAEKYGVGPSHSMFSYEQGSSANFLVPSEVEAFTKQLVEKVQENEEVVFEWVNTITMATDAVLGFVRNFGDKPATKNDYDELWKYLDEYLLGHFPVKKVVDYLPKDLLERVLPSLEKARVYAEPVYSESLEFVQKFAKDNAATFGISSDLFLCLTDTELAEAFVSKTIPAEQVLKERFEFSVITVTHGVASVISGAEAKQLAEKTIHAVLQTSELKGKTAFPGKVQGIVKVVFNPEQVTDLQPGTVLVTGMTRPEYLHLFKDAVAVVTDAGGVLSHAAITARELKKPTIVGTEVATKVLKDGDKVEVDADKGIVRKI